MEILFRPFYLIIYFLVLLTIGGAILLANIGDNTTTSSSAPLFTLPDQEGNKISLNDTLLENETAVLIFYRGYF